MKIARYTIAYSNGVIQEKDLISQFDFELHIKPTANAIHLLEVAGRKRITKMLSRFLEKSFGNNWFTDQSPLFKAKSTGALSLPTSQGGITKCTLTIKPI